MHHNTPSSAKSDQTKATVSAKVKPVCRAVKSESQPLRDSVPDTWQPHLELTFSPHAIRHINLKFEKILPSRKSLALLTLQGLKSN